MATSIFLNGKQIFIPGAYSDIKSGIKNPALNLAYGNLLVIDTGSGTGYGGGSGVNGTLKQGRDSQYTFDNVRDFKNFEKGGLWWKLSEPLFSPGGGAQGGVSSLTFIKAATTVPGTIEIPIGASDASDSDSDPSNDGHIILQLKDEGLIGNGVLTGNLLTKGYAAKIIAGISDTSKYILQFWRGTFKGTDEAVSNGSPYDNIAATSTKAQLIAESPEVSSGQELVTWMQDTTGKGYIFGLFFNLLSYALGTPDELLPEDISDYILASGGTESYSSQDLSDVLDSLEGNYDFILADNWGDDARSANNLAIQDWITNTAKIKPDMFVAAGQNIGEFANTITTAQAYDQQQVVVIHGGPKKIDIGGRTFKEYDSIYKAAVVTGRIAGLPPQVPPTFKGVGIEGEVHSLKDKEINQGLQAGVLMTRLDNGSFEIIKGINTLQNNSFLVNPDGTTHSIQLSRIIRQLNKEITVNAKQQLLKKPNGANRNTVSPEDVKAWLEGYLNSKVATDTQDNLILSFQSIDVVVSGDAYEVTYAFTPNFEVSFLVFTGTIIDPQG